LGRDGEARRQILDSHPPLAAGQGQDIGLTGRRVLHGSTLLGFCLFSL
jgi:hypothetical protein